MVNSKRKKRCARKLRRSAIIFASTVLAVSLTLLVLIWLGVFDRQKPLTDGLIRQSRLEQTHFEKLGHNLELEGVGRYSGLYMEDGSMDEIADVMMIRIKNTGDYDLRLARLFLTYSDGTAEFEITNLPAGKTMVVLEKNRRPYSEDEHLSVKLEDVVSFEENMDVFSDRYEITGMDGALNIKNDSNADVNGDLYVYYKYISGDMLYGGVTFRSKISGGLKAGELRQVSAGHFHPDNCILLAVTSEGS
jgi:hypothetical protein